MTSLQNNVDIIQDSLDDIKDAIINKGGTISGDITSYAEDILNIRSIGLNREISPQGVFQIPATNFTFSLSENSIDIGDYVLFSAFNNCTSLASVDLSSLTTISGDYALESSFRHCTNLISVDVRSLTTVSGYRALLTAFQDCTSLTSLSFPSLTTISGESALFSAFNKCTSLTSVLFPSLTTISGIQALGQIFLDCTSLTSLSFPSLTSTSFGSYTNQFWRMLSGVTGCTVHFPSNLQSVIGNWPDIVSGFNGTNTTVLFDLPATEVASNTYILTVQIKDDYCTYLSLNGTEVSHGRGGYTYTYPAGTTVAVRYDTTSQSNVTASYIMDQDRTLSIGSSTWVID